MRVRLSISRYSEFDNQLFDLLLERRKQIEYDIGMELKWRNERRECAIDCHATSSIEREDEARAWMIKTLLKFRKTLTPHLKTSFLGWKDLTVDDERR